MSFFVFYFLEWAVNYLTHINCLNEGKPDNKTKTKSNFYIWRPFIFHFVLPFYLKYVQTLWCFTGFATTPKFLFTSFVYFSHGTSYNTTDLQKEWGKLSDKLMHYIYKEIHMILKVATKLYMYSIYNIYAILVHI